MSQVYSTAQVKEHTKRSDLWMSIHGKVYNVSKFLDAHPGGEEVLVDHAGLDASGAFDDIGHSEDAHDLMKQFEIGTLDQKDAAVKATPKTSEIKVQVHDNQTNYLPFVVPVVAIVLYTVFKWLQ